MEQKVGAVKQHASDAHYLLVAVRSQTVCVCGCVGCSCASRIVRTGGEEHRVGSNLCTCEEQKKQSAVDFLQRCWFVLDLRQLVIMVAIKNTRMDR